MAEEKNMIFIMSNYFLIINVKFNNLWLRLTKSKASNVLASEEDLVVTR